MGLSEFQKFETNIRELYDAPKTEAEIIAARVRSHRKWTARRNRLRLRARLLGRRKAQPLSAVRLSSNLIDSPQPQASVTFGLRNLNPASSSETS